MVDRCSGQKDEEMWWSVVMGSCCGQLCWTGAVVSCYGQLRWLLMMDSFGRVMSVSFDGQLW